MDEENIGKIEGRRKKRSSVMRMRKERREREDEEECGAGENDKYDTISLRFKNVLFSQNERE